MLHLFATVECTMAALLHAGISKKALSPRYVLPRVEHRTPLCCPTATAPPCALKKMRNDWDQVILEMPDRGKRMWNPKTLAMSICTPMRLQLPLVLPPSVVKLHLHVQKMSSNSSNDLGRKIKEFHVILVAKYPSMKSVYEGHWDRFIAW